MLSSTSVRIFDQTYRVFGYADEGWFNVLANAGQYTEFNLENLRPLICRDSICIDAGSNLGAMTLAMAALAPEGNILSFEPDPATYAALTKTVDASGMRHIETFPWALGKGGEKGVFVEDPAWRSSSHFLPSPDGTDECRSIDRLKLPRVDLIKIDVEGAELDVLDGASETLERCRPIVLMEFNCFAFVHYRNVLPRDALHRILELFSFVAYFDKRVGGPVKLDDPEMFLRNNMLGGLVDDLICIPNGATVSIKEVE